MNPSLDYATKCVIIFVDHYREWGTNMVWIDYSRISDGARR